MTLFPYAHATHPQWRMAADLVLAQLRAQMALPDYAHAPTLALLYITDYYSGNAQDILDYLSAELPEVTDWSGTVGVGIASNNVEYFDEPALAVMLCELPSDQYRVFSGVAPLGLGFEAHTALVHADANTPDLPELIEEMALRTDSGYVFGGLSSGRTRTVQFAIGGDGNVKGQGAASGVYSGGLSGVAFASGINLVSRVTQGCLPISRARVVTAAQDNVVIELDGEPALDVMLADLGVSLDQPQEALEAVRATLVGLMTPRHADGHEAVGRTGNFGSDVIVRHIIGLDPGRRAVAVADQVAEGMQLAFCQRNVQAARADLMRICAEIREELEPEEMTMDTAHALGASEAEAAPHPARRIAGAIYVSCSGRGGPHFGGPSAELQIVRRALGDVPLVGFFAGGEIARHHLYGYTGVLTVFTGE
ncbi:MAG: FIST C-terminal domain-containing protein [Gammaproteobacteria bacterium]|nr:FIST C-terminal domain-containing protein [Gammaproteobacteria bacterium]MBU0788093.1 FIST C-terminal domain-containing protein [Gammaproteobacteria bacterium]MBU0815409.1 FIST C-terminal domain-containing protein [Gammaproteobacteria bacterium]MBU1785483.1 FIST C-terminal domain-containing protein [Gammaproteobacteria bacterium]